MRLNISTDLRPFAQVHLNRHDALMPGFAKTNASSRLVSLMQHAVLGHVE